MRITVRTTAIFIIIIFLYNIHYYFNNKENIKLWTSQFPKIESRKTSLEEGGKSSRECCSRRNASQKYFYKNILFLKTHKCASSTVQNILMRFGLRLHLNFALPKNTNYLGYFGNFSESLLAPSTKTVDGKYNLLVHHTRFDKQLKRIMYNDTMFVTILRKPSSLFESSFHFFKLNKNYGKNFSEFLNFLPLTSNGTSHFYAAFDKNATKVGRIHDRNQMSLDLGLSRDSFQNITAIRNFINKIDKEFDLVMISEYMEASLTLLANLMGWPLEYVTFFPINSRPDGIKYKLSDADKTKLLHLNYADHLLYNHFLDKFRKCVSEYGISSLLHDVVTLTRINHQIRRKCITNEERKGYGKTISYKLKNNDWICTHSTKSELVFTKEVKNEQTKRLRRSVFTRIDKEHIFDTNLD